MPRPRPSDTDSPLAALLDVAPRCRCGSADVVTCDRGACFVRACHGHRQTCDTCGLTLCQRCADAQGRSIGGRWYCEDCAPELPEHAARPEAA
jgi:hypothetical protein